MSPQSSPVTNANGRMILTVLFAVALMIGTREASQASNAHDLVTAFQTILECPLDPSTTLQVEDLTIESGYVRMALEQGRMALLEAVILDSVPQTYGAYFEGRGRLQLDAPAELERHQLRTHCGRDRVDAVFESVLILASGHIIDSLVARSSAASEPFGAQQIREAKERFKQRPRTEGLYHPFQLLTNMLSGSRDPFLWISAQLEDIGRTVCVVDPLQREEVLLYKVHWEPGQTVFTPVCRFSQDLRPSHRGVGGRDKSSIRITDYDLTSSITQLGHFYGQATLNAINTGHPVQALRLELHGGLQVRSVTDSLGEAIPFMRIDNHDYPSPFLYLFLEHPLQEGEATRLTLTYDGEDMIGQVLGGAATYGGSSWYPTTDERHPARFGMIFKTPESYKFVASGQLVDSWKEADSLVTSWQVEQPARLVTFSLGTTDKYSWSKDTTFPIDVYCRRSDKKMALTVANDVFRAVRLFEHDFGSCDLSHLSVCETGWSHGAAYPGLLQMGRSTWFVPDLWTDRHQIVFRAHEVAHLWWGLGVDHDTYHDQWLSEGFAEYSGLLYLQATEGNDVFFDWMAEYRDQVFAAHELGPVALGYRNATRDHPDGHQLATYMKGAFVLHMIRGLLTDIETLDDSRFFQMMQAYFDRYRGQQVATDDFRRMVEEYANTDLRWFFDQWIYSAELPRYSFSYDLIREGDGTYRAHCDIAVDHVSDEFKMYVPVEVRLKKDRKAYLRIMVEGPHREFDIPGLPEKPEKLKLNPFETVLARVSQ